MLNQLMTKPKPNRAGVGDNEQIARDDNDVDRIAEYSNKFNPNAWLPSEKKEQHLRLFSQVKKLRDEVYYRNETV